MDSAVFEKLISNHPNISQHHDYLLGLRAPSVTIHIAKESPQKLESKFGGEPIAPENFKWPLHESGYYVFLGHINFSEIVDAPHDLPQSGILSLFYAQDDEGEIFWGDDSYILGYFWEDTSELIVKKAPHRHVVKQKKIRLIGSTDIPRHEELRCDWPFPFEDIENLLEEAQLPSDYLLGYPSFYSLAYDPTPNNEWCSLLTLHSHDQFDWCWHDGDKLMIFIEKTKLANKDFSHLKADAG
jgi:uncharacterized protein YwqG